MALKRSESIRMLIIKNIDQFKIDEFCYRFIPQSIRFLSTLIAPAPVGAKTMIASDPNRSVTLYEFL